MAGVNLEILCWNVRGLNNVARRETVLETIATTSCHLVCLQETKLILVDQFLAASLGGPKLDMFCFKPAGGFSGTCGGILILWNSDFMELVNCTQGEYHILAHVQMKESNVAFLLTMVYGPARNGNKVAFLRELQDLKPQLGTSWLILGDFNCIYKARDKNNNRLNMRLMNQFRQAIDECELKELHLQNRKFTWSNERQRPMLVRLDRIFCNGEWEDLFGSHGLQALSSSLSDHCPLLLSNQTSPRRPHSFQFENFWERVLGFKQVVQTAWMAPSVHHEPFHRLYHKLQNTAVALHEWNDKIIPDARLYLHMALEVVLRLDLAQENRQLSPAESSLRNKLKQRIIGLAVVERARRRQNSRLTTLKLGDANTRFFSSEQVLEGARISSKNLRKSMVGLSRMRTSLWRSKVFSKALCNVLNLGKWRLIMASSTLSDIICPPLTCLLLKQKFKKLLTFCRLIRLLGQMVLRRPSLNLVRT
jgi:exonuclease III